MFKLVRVLVRHGWQEGDIYRLLSNASRYKVDYAIAEASLDAE
jgi:hypothetical protein